ncbi:carboxymuconolactone decarboxylase family protein [Teredinibacter sp. KSP-S5-2]|uniref:carboxymuconolactone decarboxylase family protein n=1 Tax=Teredinibacter sp. KSP-S5-2 TaxID=3034506 RepID=UPI002934C515|nr:carboxymuconolactone decarboxylase family protein [Teredinibacter sp. KSP-S5-2]WNO07783.1 carboxymuconolactone decarboxylase family protein [Teredinibacter sp. KSP-S5-2]
MGLFTHYSIETAPQAAKPLLEQSKKALGFVPNLYAYLAESPAALKSYVTLSGLLEQGSLTPEQQQVVLLAVSVYNQCEFCVSAHSVIAKQFVKVDSKIVEALRNNTPLPDAKLEALAVFSRQVAEKRGWLAEEDIQSFIDAGFNKAQVLDVVLGVTLKTLSNYSSHITGTTVNKELESEYWAKPD